MRDKQAHNKNHTDMEYPANICPTEVTKTVYTLFAVTEGEEKKEKIIETTDDADLQKAIEDRKYFLNLLGIENQTLEVTETTIGSFTGFIEDETTWVVD